MKFLINLMLYSFLYIFILFPLFDWIASDHIHWDVNIIVGILCAFFTALVFPLYEGK